MKRTLLRSPVVETPHKWLNSFEGQWEYGEYKYCYLTVRRTQEGKYKPCVNGCNNLHLENWKFNDPRPLLFDTLEEAQQHAFKYMDALRDREAAELIKIKEGLRAYAYVQTITSKER